MSDEILERLKRLEDENRRLTSLLTTQPAEVVTVKPTRSYVDLWQGKPILRFDGPFKPFGIGWKKASVILECIDALRHFVENNKDSGGLDGD